MVMRFLGLSKIILHLRRLPDAVDLGFACRVLEKHINSMRNAGIMFRENALFQERLGDVEEPKVEIPLVVYKGDERIVIGTAKIDDKGFVTAKIDPVRNPEVKLRIETAIGGEFALSLGPADPLQYPFKDVFRHPSMWLATLINPYVDTVKKDLKNPGDPA